MIHALVTELYFNACKKRMTYLLLVLIPEVDKHGLLLSLSLLCIATNSFFFYSSFFLIIAILFFLILSSLLLPLYQFSFLPVLFQHGCCPLIAISHSFFFYSTLYLPAFKSSVSLQCAGDRWHTHFVEQECHSVPVCGKTEGGGSGGTDDSKLRFTNPTICKILNMAPKG